MQPLRKERQSNIELYRIIVMLLIIAHHSVVHSGVLQEFIVDGLNAKPLFFAFLGMWGKTGIDCFVLITGYFMCTSKITVHKFLKLFLEIEFYAITIYLAFAFFGVVKFSSLDFVKVCLPVKQVSTNFTSCFLLFYLFIPFLNILVHNMDRKTHGLLLLLCLTIYSIIGTIWPITFNYVTWFVILYIISSYIRFYNPFVHLTRIKLGGVLMVCVLLSMSSVVFMQWLNTIHSTDIFYPYTFVHDCNTLLAVLTSVSLFLYFKDMKVKQSHFINTVASTTFGVFLIHDSSDAMRKWLWGDMFHCTDNYTSPHAIVNALIFVIAVFIICSIIDYLRIISLERPAFKYIDKLLEKYNVK